MDKIYKLLTKAVFQPAAGVMPVPTANVIPESCSRESQPYKMTKRLRPQNPAGRQTLGNDARQIKRTCGAGFTLIELLVVVLIIGILAAVALPQYEAAVKKSKLTQALIWASTVREAEQVYRLANGNYTSDVSELDVQLPGCQPMEDAAGWVCANGLTVSFFVNNGVVRSVYVHVAAREAAVEYYFDSGVRHCVIPPGDKSWERVCRSMGGKQGTAHPNYFILP